MSNRNNYSNNNKNSSGLHINNEIGQQLIYNKFYTLNSNSISQYGNTIDTKTTGNQTNLLTNGNYNLTSETGNIWLTSDRPYDRSIYLNASNANGGISFDSGSGGINFATSGDMAFATNGNVNLGNDDTVNIDITAQDYITLSTTDINLIATDDILIKSTNGEIILDTDGNTGNTAIRVLNDGKVSLNNDSNIDGFQLGVNVANDSSPASGINGIIVDSSNASVAPEVRIKYENTDGSRRVINSMGVYSEASRNAIDKSYIAYQYGNQIITLDGPQFENKDIGKLMVFQQNSRETTITSLGKIILPTDNSYATSNIIAGGVYTGTTNKTFKIELDKTDSQNNGNGYTFKWSNDAGITYQETNIPITFAVGQRYPLEDGVYIEFAHATNHEENDFWIINAQITAIVDSNIIITGSTTNDGSSGTIVTGVVNNSPTTTTSTLGAPVFSNIAGNIALSGVQKVITNSPFQGFFGTNTQSDLILKTADLERLRITADGSIGVSKDNIDARLHITSNFNKSILVNDNIMNSNAAAGGEITDTSNIGSNLLGNQMNSASSELNTGGYIIVYESQESATSYYDIYGDYFTANGDKNNVSFRINYDQNYNQSHPHICKSGNLDSGNYMVVWASNDPTDNTIYQIRGQIFTNGIEPVYPTRDILIAYGSSDLMFAPKVAGLRNGNYVITYSSFNTSTNYYDIYYVIVDSTGQQVQGETLVSSSASTNKHNIYSNICGLSINDPNYPGGFVITYLKQLYQDNLRYQIVYKIYTADASSSTSELKISNTGISDTDDISANSDLSLTDGLPIVYPVSDNTSLTNNGGFYVSYQTTYTASIDYSAIIAFAQRTIFGNSSYANGTLTGSSINGTTGVQTLTIEDIGGNFVVGETIYFTISEGYVSEKIESITILSSTSIEITLSQDPREIILAHINSGSSDTDANNKEWQKVMNSNLLQKDKEREGLSAIHDNTLPEDFTRNNNDFYAFRVATAITHNEDDEIICVWESGYEPNIYYQRMLLANQTFIEGEKVIDTQKLGLRQTSPFINTLKTNQRNLLGYAINFTSNARDLSKNSVYQELIGAYGFLLHINNNTAEFVVSHDGKMGIGTNEPNGTLHIKSQTELNPNNKNDELTHINIQNTRTGINNENDFQRISFLDGNDTELARIKVKYSDAYQDLNPKSENLVGYFKFDETPGSFFANNSGLYNIGTDTTRTTTEDGQLVNFDVNICWKEGKINNGLEFLGEKSLSYVYIHNNTNLNDRSGKIINDIYLNSFTIGTWIKVQEYNYSGRRMNIFSFDEQLGSDNDLSPFYLYLHDHTSTGKLYPCFDYLPSSGDNTLTTIQTSTTQINDGEWHYLVYIYDSSGRTLKIYLDNIELSNTSSVTNTDETFNGDSYIGVKKLNAGTFEDYFEGMLDEMRFYSTALTTTDLDKLWKYGNEQRTQFIIQTIGDNQSFDDYSPGFVLDDTGSIVNCRVRSNNYRQISGVLSVASNTATTVTGTNTLFTREVKIGDVLFIDNKDNSDDDDENILNKNLYEVIAVNSDTELEINRPIKDAVDDNLFQYVTVYPSILSAFDLNNNNHFTMYYNGNSVFGSGISKYNHSRLELRGSGNTLNDTNGLSITNTDSNIYTSNIDGGHANRIIFNTTNYENDEVLQGMLKFAHSNNSSNNSSKFQVFVNGGSVSSNTLAMTHLMTGYDNGKIHIGPEIEKDKVLGDIHITGREDKVNLVMYSKEEATGVYKEKSELTFYGSASHNYTTDENTHFLGQILVSNDNSNSSNSELANGRIDFKVNSETGSGLEGAPQTKLDVRSSMSITSGRLVSVHNTRPTNKFQVSPEYIDNAGLIYNSANISSSNIISNELTFDNDILPDITKTRLLRGGTIVINDGSNLTSYLLSDNSSTLIDSSNRLLELNSLLSLDSNLINNKSFNIYYPGFHVNSYGLVGIGDSSFNDTETSYHLTVAGNTQVKGEIHFSENIMSESISNVSIRTSNISALHRIQVKDDTTEGYIKLIGGPLSTEIENTTNDVNLNWTDSTVLIDTSGSNTTVTLPDPETKYRGYLFTVKKIHTNNTLTITCNVNIDGSSANIPITNLNESYQLQNDGSTWFIIGKYTP